MLEAVNGRGELCVLVLARLPWQEDVPENPGVWGAAQLQSWKNRAEESNAEMYSWESLESEFSLYLLPRELSSWVHCTQLGLWHETPVGIFSLPSVQILQGENVKTSFSNFIAFVCWACEIPEVTLTWFSKLNFLWHPLNSYCISNNNWQRKSPSQLSACPRVHSAGGKGNCPGILSQCSLREVTQLNSGYFVLSSDF